jgi:hypothetical protein
MLSGKVFGLGLSKTGTSSLTAALNILGVPSIHYPHDERTLSELQSGEFHLSILENYQSITDLPAVAFYKEFDREFPGSKFVLTVREKSAWLRSCEMHWQLLEQWIDNFPEFKRAHTYLSNRVYGGLTFERERFAMAFETHAANVREYFRGRERDFLLLDICSGEGWSKLCAFLETEEPAVPFPHANEWMHLLMDAAGDLQHTIPTGTTLILVDEQGFGKQFAPHNRCLPFLEHDGEYWGAPTDDAIARVEFDRLLEKEDPAYIVFGWPAYWWFDCYSKFSNYLRSTFRCVLENERLTVFDLKSTQ